jgi:hypothetical protein
VEPPAARLVVVSEAAGARESVHAGILSQGHAKQLDKGSLIGSAELAGTVQLWEWIGDDGATTFSY